MSRPVSNQTEAEYAYQLQKWIIPLMMDMYYEPDGWLGLILGAKYYMDFSGIVLFEESVQKLTRELDSSKGSFESKYKYPTSARGSYWKWKFSNYFRV